VLGLLRLLRRPGVATALRPVPALGRPGLGSLRAAGEVAGVVVVGTGHQSGITRM
jgi:hypothetical protein